MSLAGMFCGFFFVISSFESCNVAVIIGLHLVVEDL